MVTPSGDEMVRNEFGEVVEVGAQESSYHYTDQLVETIPHVPDIDRMGAYNNCRGFTRTRRVMAVHTLTHKVSMSYMMVGR